MLAEQRFEIILQELNEHRAAGVPRLCELTGASEATIRRDLNALARQGKLNKVHGGAVASGGEFLGEEPDVGTKERLHQAEKERIARYAAELICDDDVVYLDAGTTTVRMVEHLKQSKATFDNQDIGAELRKKGVIAQLDGLNVVKIASNRLPEKFGFMIAHPVATVAPVKLAAYKIHLDPPFLSGSLVEGRIYYDCFVLENKAKAIYYQAIA